MADEACRKKEMHLESFGMLLNCKLGKFSGVEYVCCPNESKSVMLVAMLKQITFCCKSVVSYKYVGGAGVRVRN